ncbi:hypothetical protein D0T53_01580 [Dysgonomonas sp. 216]|uniref:hypothetical protein n=1 Tax=Dysgonomonas sp. 216 TaxID=2302934 RepID=UPI0013D2D4FE|nr:hypothetical protein [Dysgonomonas sp. 216]NDW17606.1 hypothetical protein [Dysgonomonas sp. 216]
MGLSDFENEKQTKQQLEMNAAAMAFLKETAKWAKILSIIGFVGLSFLALIAVISGLALSSMAYGGATGTMQMVIILIMVAIYFVPVYYLYQFATKTLDAFRYEDSESLTQGLKNLKSHYMFIGIFTIIVLSIYLLIFIAAAIGAAAF